MVLISSIPTDLIFVGTRLAELYPRVISGLELRWGHTGLACSWVEGADQCRHLHRLGVMHDHALHELDIHFRELRQARPGR